MAEEVKLSWSGAQVDDAQLTVPLDGEHPKGWKDTFERTVKLLGAGEWGEIKLRKDNVQVSDVTPGTEEKLRHHLESIVAQANATEARHEAQERREAEQDGDEGSERDGPDAEMTARFQAFAQAEEPED